MIISHKYRFIFIKTAKTAGTSIETYLSSLCGDEDVCTPFSIEELAHQPKNYSNYFNPLPEIWVTKFNHMKRTFKHVKQKRKYYNHMPAYLIQCRTPKKIWNNYFKFCVERNPWDKTLSHYHFIKRRHEKYKDLSLANYFKLGMNCINHPKYTDYNNPSKIIVDKIARYENLNNELASIFDRLGIPFDGDLGIHAKGNYRKDRRSYQDVLTQEQAKVIEDIHHQEIKLLGYKY